MRNKLVIINLILCLSLFVSCGSSSKNANSSATDSAMGYVESNKIEVAEEGSGVNNELSDSTKLDENIYYSDERKLINNADLTMETTKFTEAIASLEKLSVNLGGYIESSNVYQKGINEKSYNESRNGYFVIRIPKEKFEEFLNNLVTLGVITNKRVYAEDITSKYYDTEARLKVLKAQEERYLEILKGTNNIEQILEVEKYLTEVRYEIESITVSLKQMDNLVDYSTININIYEVVKVSEPQKVPTTLGEKISKVFLDSINSIKSVSTSLILVLIAIIPYSVIIAIIFMIIYLIIKNRKDKKNNNN